MLTQERLKNALHACVNNACFALEQLERAAHEATGVCFAESREIYKLGKEHLVLCWGGRAGYLQRMHNREFDMLHMRVTTDESQGKHAWWIHAAGCSEQVSVIDRS